MSQTGVLLKDMKGCVTEIQDESQKYVKILLELQKPWGS